MGIRDYLGPTTFSSPDEAQQFETQVIPSGEFGRGMVSNRLESQAGDYLSQALDAELKQDPQTASALRAKAAHTMSFAPKMQTSDEGLGGYAAGVLGRIAPDLPKFGAAALAGRGLGRFAIGPEAAELGGIAGGAAPMYPMMRNQALMQQQGDPTAMAASPEERAASAQRQGLLGAALGAVPLSHAVGSAVKPGIRGLFQGMGTTAAEQALINPALTAYGQSEATRLNPGRDVSGDAAAIREAALSGAIGGAGMHGAFALPGLPIRLAGEAAHGISAASDAARAGAAAARPGLEAAGMAASDVGGKALDAAGDVFDQGVSAAKDTAAALKERFGPAADAAMAKGTDFAKRGVAAAQDAFGRVPEAIRTSENPGDFLSQVFPKIRKPTEAPKEQSVSSEFPASINDTLGPAPPGESIPSMAGKSAGEIFKMLKEKSKGGGDALKQYYQQASDALGGTHNPTTPEGQRQIVDALQARANDFGGKLKEFTDSFKDASKSSFYGGKNQTTPELERIAFEHLTPAAKNDPDVMDKLPDLVHSVATMMARGGDQDAGSVTAYKRIEGMFNDPDKFEAAMGKALKQDPAELSRLRGIDSAEKDASQHDSFLYSSLPSEQKDSLKSGQLQQVGALVDRLRGAKDADYEAGLQKLSLVFGSEDKAQKVVDYYSKSLRDNGSVSVPDRVPGLGFKKPREISSQEDLAGHGVQGESEYIFKNAEAARPFFAGEDNSNHVKAAEADNLRTSHVNYLDFAHEHGLDVEGESKRLQGDAKARLDDIIKKGVAAAPGSNRRQELANRYTRLKKQMDLMEKVQNSDKPTMVEGHGKVAPGHEGVLELHGLLRGEKADKEARISATTGEMKKAGPTGHEAQSIRGTLVNAMLKDPVTGTVKPRSLSLETMARHELRDNPSEYGNHATYGGKLTAAASRGLAKIMARPDFVRFEKSATGNELHDLVVHRQSDTRMSLKDIQKKSAAQFSPEEIDSLVKGKEKVSAAIEKYKGLGGMERAEMKSAFGKRLAELKAAAKGEGPAAAFAKRKAEYVDSAMKKIWGVEQNEGRTKAADQINKELPELTHRSEPDVQEREAVDIRRHEAGSMKEMRAMVRAEGHDPAGMTPKDMRKLIPFNKRDEFDYHNFRQYAANDMAGKKERAVNEFKNREAQGLEEPGTRESNAATAADKAARQFKDDFEMYGREGDQGKLKEPKRPLRYEKPDNINEDRGMTDEEHPEQVALQKSIIAEREALDKRGESENPSIAKDGAEESTKHSDYYTKGAGPELQLDEPTKQYIRDSLAKTVGPHVVVDFESAFGGKAGSYTPKTEDAHALIKIAVNSQAAMESTAHHESMHHLFQMMSDNARSPQARKAYKDMKEVAQTPMVQRQLRQILADHPDALAQLHDTDESLAYMYQFWRQGKINLSQTGIKWFEKIRDFIYNTLGIVSKTQKVEEIMSAFKDGSLSDESLLDPALRDIKGRTLRDRFDELAPGVGKAFDALLLSATDRLRSYGHNSLDKLADLFHKEPDRESGSLGFIQQRSMVNGMELNRFQDALGPNVTHVDVTKALRNLQSMKDIVPGSLEERVRGQLDRLFGYMDRAGVKMQAKDGKFAPISNFYAKDYFPRVWDRRFIDTNRNELRDLFVSEGKMKTSEANSIIDGLVSGDGLVDLAENEHHIGFTPANQALMRRTLDFIDKSNADKFAKFQSQDMNEIMSKYIYQATHRGEYARAFGNDGEVIKAAFKQAADEGMSAADIAKAQKAVMALEGTLGHDFNPQLRKLFTGLTAYENVVLLPFALLSSLSDAAGISLRSNEFGDQFKALQRGFTGITKQLTRQGEAGDSTLETAKKFGIVDSLNMLENYGSFYNSSFMSPTLRRINDKFFRWNGMEMWNKQMRLSGFESAQRFVLRNLGDRRYMDELGLKQADIPHLKANADGGIDFDSLPPPTLARIQGAMYRFVDGAVLRPNAAQRPVWASDPAFMLIAHLKQFAFSFHNTFLKRYGNELGHGNPRAIPLFLSFLPFGIFSGAVRRSLAGQGAFASMTLPSIIDDGMMRSGMYGSGMFLDDAIGDVHRGRLPGTSFLGPTAEHAQKVLETITGGPESPHQLLLRSTPLSPLVKDFSPAPD